MNFESVFRLLTEQFPKYNIEFALIGGFALYGAGVSRATQDIDVMIHKEDVPKVRKLMDSLGYTLVHESEDVMNFVGKLKQLGQVDFLHAHRRYAKAMLARAVTVKILNNQFEVKMIVPEDLIGLKVQSSSNDPSRKAQDMADIENIIRFNHNKLDLNLVHEYFDVFERREELQLMLKKIDDADTKRSK